MRVLKKSVWPFQVYVSSADAANAETWLSNNVLTSNWIITANILAFKNSQDLMLYKLSC